MWHVSINGRGSLLLTREDTDGVGGYHHQCPLESNNEVDGGGGALANEMPSIGSLSSAFSVTKVLIGFSSRLSNGSLLKNATDTVWISAPLRVLLVPNDES